MILCVLRMMIVGVDNFLAFGRRGARILVAVNKRQSVNSLPKVHVQWEPKKPLIVTKWKIVEVGG